MKDVPMKNVVLLGCLLAVVTAPGWAGGAAEPVDERPRGFMFTIGAGPAQIYYGAEAESLLSAAEAVGLERMELALSIDAGWALGNDLYAVGCVEGFATRLYDSYGDYVQLNSYLYGGGLRLYPFHTGLVLGVDGGLARAVIISSIGVDASSLAGWAAAASIAYDFNPNPTGFSLVVGIRANYNMIEGFSASAVSLNVDLVWK